MKRHPVDAALGQVFDSIGALNTFRDWARWKLDDAWQWCQRVIYCHHNARVLADMEWRFGCVLDHMGTYMSKAYYPLEVMYVQINDVLERTRDEATDEALFDYQHPSPAAAWTKEDGAVLWWWFDSTGTPLEQPWCGTWDSPDFPNHHRHKYHTHWTPFVKPELEHVVESPFPDRP